MRQCPSKASLSSRIRDAASMYSRNESRPSTKSRELRSNTQGQVHCANLRDHDNRCSTKYGRLASLARLAAAVLSVWCPQSTMCIGLSCTSPTSVPRLYFLGAIISISTEILRNQNPGLSSWCFAALSIPKMAGPRYE